jgi:hypothetical protein
MDKSQFKDALEDFTTIIHELEKACTPEENDGQHLPAEIVPILRQQVTIGLSLFT